MATITPDDGGAGGIFTPASLEIDDANPVATFTYKPAAQGAALISLTNDSGFLDPPSLPYEAKLVALTYSLSGPPTIAKGVASAPFTLALPPGTITNGVLTITPNDGGAGGVFAPTSVALSASLADYRDKIAPRSASAQFTYTPAAGGHIAINTTNDGGLTDPIGFNYSIPLVDGDVVRVWPDSSSLLNDALKIGKLVDSCAQGDTLVGMQDVQWWQLAQSFTAVAGRLFSAKFNLNPYAGGGLGTGNVRAHLYAATGVSGTSAMPTGPALATSDPVAVTTMGIGWIEFFFTGANAFNMVAGTVYCIAVDAAQITGSPIGVYYWGSGTHHVGNMSGQLGANAWSAWGTGTDVPFKLYVEGNPTFKENIIAPAGWPVVRLGAVGDGFFLKNLISGAGDWSVIAVVKPINPVAGVTSFVMAGANDAGPYAMYFDGAGVPQIYAGNRVNSGGYRTWTWETTWRVWFIGTNAGGTGLVCYIDGGGQSGSFNATPYTGDFKTIGGRSFDDLFPGNLDIADLLFCSQELSDTTIKNATQTLSDKYGLGLAVGTAMDLSTLPALKGWWKANTLGGGIITKPWLDKGPLANSAKPIGAPLLVKNSLNGNPIVRLRSASKDGFNLVTAIPNTAPYTAFVVMRSAGSNGPLSLCSATQHGTGSYWGGIWYGGCSWYSLSAGVGAEASNWHCIGNTQVSPAIAKIYQDGVYIPNGGGGTDANPFVTIGYQGGSFGDGDLALILMCDGLLSDPDRQNAEKTISVKYGTPAPPAGSVIDLATLPNIRCWWEADSLL